MYKISTPSKTREILNKYNIKLHKRWGQNFLVDPRIASAIVEAACEPGEGVIEIGPGIGSLTEILLSRAGWIIAVEIDPRLTGVLKQLFKDAEHLTVIEGDILDYDLDALAAKYFPKDLAGGKYRVVGNLPYYVTTPILLKLFETTKRMLGATLMLQKEVADRLTAAPGGKDYGSLSVACQFYSVPQVVARVSRRNFFPLPDVDSTVVKFQMREKPAVDVADKKLFFTIVRAAFNQRRKTILNSLSNLVPDMTREKVAVILRRAGIDPFRRAEDLSLGEFAAICNAAVEFKV